MTEGHSKEIKRRASMNSRSRQVKKYKEWGDVYLFEEIVVRFEAAVVVEQFAVERGVFGRFGAQQRHARVEPRRFRQHTLL